VIFGLNELRSRWQSRNIPLACPSDPNCSGHPDRSLARFALAKEELRCTRCGKVALALHWRTEGLLQAGQFQRD
jgi:hypothetical protein